MTTTSKPWDYNAPCKGLWDLFFPELDEDGNEVGPTDEARAICAACPLQGECLDNAIVTRMEYGIAGGLNKKERESLRMQTYRHTKRSGFEEALEEVLVGIG